MLPGGDFATTTDGKASTVFREVVDWGPRSTPVDTPFNPQGEDDSAIWINTAPAPQPASITRSPGSAPAAAASRAASMPAR